MSRYVTVVQIEIDDGGRLCVLPNEHKRIEDRNIDSLQKPIPFIRYGIVDRARQNKTVYSSFDIIDVMETCRVFNNPPLNKKSSSSTLTQEDKTL